MISSLPSVISLSLLFGYILISVDGQRTSSSPLSWELPYDDFYDDVDDGQRTSSSPLSWGLPYDEFYDDVVNHFSCQAGINQRQFAVLLFIPPSFWPFQYIVLRNYVPYSVISTDNSQICFPAPGNAVTYMAARFEQNSEGTTHAEAVLLDRENFMSMLNNFVYVYGTYPESVVIFSWLIPCADCRDVIVERFTENPLRNIPNRVVIYNQQPTTRNNIDFNNMNSLIRLMSDRGRASSSLVLLDWNIH